MKLVPCIAALAAGVLALSACGNDEERMAENAYREADTIPYTPSPAPPSTAPVYPNPDPNTIPPTTNPDSPTNPDGAFPPSIPPATTPPALN